MTETATKQEEEEMFGRKKQYRPPDRPFNHASGCKILAADATVQIPWQRLEYGQWRRECVCGTEGWTEPLAKTRPARPVRPGHQPPRGRVRVPRHN
jgi:hypothetical protein